jgi:ubiquinone/menaquinone biosynthesis C-methylase UbiE
LGTTLTLIRLTAGHITVQQLASGNIQRRPSNKPMCIGRSISTPQQSSSDYVMGYSEQEQQRLMLQAAILRPWTERFFRAAGLGTGMRVLDVGCGAGDVSLLAAELVGPTGKVVGVDRDASSLELAQWRAAQESCDAWLTFENASLEMFSCGETFDAVVGRYILLYQSDPSAVLRRLADCVRPGGLVVFHEVDFGRPHVMFPDPPLWHKICRLVGETFRRSGASPDFGLKLTRTFLDAGLPRPTVKAVLPVASREGSPLFAWLAMGVKTLLPRIEELGLATAEEIQVDTLAERMEAEAMKLGTQLLGPVQFGAWIRKP